MATHIQHTLSPPPSTLENLHRSCYKTHRYKRTSRKLFWLMFCVRASLVTPVATRMQRLVCVRALFAVLTLVAMTELVKLTFDTGTLPARGKGLSTGGGRTDSIWSEVRVSQLSGLASEAELAASRPRSFC
jgi:hypothetical protein